MQKSRKPARNQPRGGFLSNDELETSRVFKTRAASKPIEPKTMAQARYFSAIASSIITIGDGTAGTGKTFIAAAIAADAFKNGEIEKIIVTRPVIEAGRSLGFLPGDMNEKTDPYFAPVLEVLESRLGTGPVEYAIKAEKIIFKPLGFMRGCTFANAFVIADEMQNSTPEEMYLLLTRIGEDARVVINGDMNQRDLQGRSGLQDAIHMLKNIDGVSRVTFGIDDVVRSGIAKAVIIAYANRNAHSEKDTPFDGHQPDFFES